MTAPNVLATLREWQTVDEAVQLLSQMFKEPVTKADIYRLGLDGHLKLAVFLPEGTIANCWNLAEDTPPSDVENGGNNGDEALLQDDVEDDHDPTGVGIIGGVWDLSMGSSARLQVESWFNALCDLPQVGLDGRTGAVVRQPGRLCRLRAEGEKYSSPASVLPAGSQIVVRTSALLKFASEVEKLAKGSTAASIDKPLHTKERGTLLTMVAALAKEAGIAVEEPYAAAETISALIDALGSTVSPSTIAPHLKSISEALERTGKTAP